MLAATTVGAYLVARKWLGLPLGRLGQAVRRTLEGVGMSLVFLVLNLTAGAVTILIIRAVTGHFLSIYALSDVTIGILSLVQGLIFQAWRGVAVGQSGSRGAPPRSGHPGVTRLRDEQSL